MTQQQILQLRRRDLQPFNLDHFFNPILDVNHPQLVNMPHIPRVQEPLRVKTLLRRRRVAQISHHRDLRALRPDLPGLPHAQLPPVVDAHHFRHRVRHQLAPRRGVLVVEKTRRVRGDARRALRRAVALPEPGPGELLLQQGNDLGGDRRRAGRPALHVAQAGQVRVHDGVAHEADQDGRHEDEFFDAVLDDGVEHGRHGEGGQHDGVAVHEGRVMAEAHHAGDFGSWGGPCQRP